MQVSVMRLVQRVLKRVISQLSWCENPIFVVPGKVLKELKLNNSIISKLQPLGFISFLWILRHLVKWHCERKEQQKAAEPTVDSCVRYMTNTYMHTHTHHIMCGA